jgi:ketosteroid isomerase-like protein
LDNSEIVHDVFAAFAERDLPRLASHFSPQAEIVGGTPYAEKRTFPGSEGLRALFEHIDQEFERVDAFVRSVLEVNETRVLVEGSIDYRRRLGGGLGHALYWVFDIADGLVTRVESFDEKDAAYAAAGAKLP